MTWIIAILARLGLSKGLSRALGYLVPIGLAAACVGFLWLRGSHYEHQRDTARAQVAAVNARLAVSNASIDRLQAVIAQRNAEIEASAKAYAAAKAAAATDAAKLADKARSTDAKIARLQALSKEAGPCPVKAEVRQLAEGL